MNASPGVPNFPRASGSGYNIVNLAPALNVRNASAACATY
ncbi:hypothetical protein ACVWYQ_006350 [Bradyrhizobium sp. USDA 3397]